MKKIAVLFIFLFTLVQAGSAICSLVTSSAAFFLVDKEKGDEKPETEKKESKEKITVSEHSLFFSDKVSIAFHLIEKINPSPSLEKQTPPPNFC
jgi:Na+-transporting methylmalonyl-CoA/oxaloacetate decarboxylase gamma subunit